MHRAELGASAAAAAAARSDNLRTGTIRASRTVNEWQGAVCLAGSVGRHDAFTTLRVVAAAPHVLRRRARLRHAPAVHAQRRRGGSILHSRIEPA